MASVEERNARLAALAEASTVWADKRSKQLKEAVVTAKAILKGRTGSERLATATAKAASELIVDEVDAFLLTTE